MLYSKNSKNRVHEKINNSTLFFRFDTLELHMVGTTKSANVLNSILFESKIPFIRMTQSILEIFYLKAYNLTNLQSMRYGVIHLYL